MKTLKVSIGPKEFLSNLMIEYAEGQDYGSSEIHFDPETGQMSECIVYYPLQPGEHTAKEMIHSVFLPKPLYYEGDPEYAWTKTSYPDGTDLECLRTGPGKYEEYVRYPAHDQEPRRVKEHTMYVLRKAEFGSDTDSWIVASRECLDPNGVQTLISGFKADGSYYWIIRHREEGVVSEFVQKPLCTLIDENDYREGSTQPFRTVKFGPLWVTVWSKDEKGNINDSFTFRHVEVVGDFLPIISQIVHTVWKDGKPVFDQGFYLDVEASRRAGKLVYVFRDVAPIKRYGDKYLRVVVHKGRNTVQMITLADMRIETQAENQAYSWEYLPESKEHHDGYTPGQKPPRSKTVWTFRPDGSQEYVAEFDYGGDIQNLRAFPQANGQNQSLPQSRRQIDGDLFPDYGCDDDLPPDIKEVPPMAIPKKIADIDPKSLDSCPTLDPEWFVVPVVPPAPELPPTPPRT